MPGKRGGSQEIINLSNESISQQKFRAADDKGGPTF